ncbi:MAG: T9SS type A sorting domain-containing protein [Cytophagaceae bacterium]|nr:MAG: T9SS type A sorting domain-containing protein [Cytophagaceae bacterium]
MRPNSTPTCRPFYRPTMGINGSKSCMGKLRMPSYAPNSSKILVSLYETQPMTFRDYTTTPSSTGTTYLDVRLNGGTVLATRTAQPGLPGVEVYPNPAHGQFVVKVSAALRPAASATPLRLYNAVGQLVLEQPLQLSAAGEVAVSVAQLPAGIYTVRLALSTGVATYRVAVY